MDISRELLAAIGEVVVAATNLEYSLGQLVTTRWGWDEQHEDAMVAVSGRVREYVKRLVDADRGWESVRELQQRALAVLEERNKLVHSVVVYAMTEDDQVHHIEMWHAKTRTVRVLPSVQEVEKLTRELHSCSQAVFWMMSEAASRFEELGATDAPQPPKPLRYARSDDGTA